MDKPEIVWLIKKRKIKLLPTAYRHIYAGELSMDCLWETLEEGIFLTREQLIRKLPQKVSSYAFPFYILHKLTKFIIYKKPVLLGFYVKKGTIRIGHFSSCSAEAKFYEQFKKESQNPSFKN